jgi:hypothetical protein
VKNDEVQNREMSWILEEAYKSDPRKDRIVLENPLVVKEPDGLLLNEYYPFIHSELKKTKYRFIPLPDDVKISSIWSCGDLGRALIFMLFDDMDYSSLKPLQYILTGICIVTLFIVNKIITVADQEL